MELSQLPSEMVAAIADLLEARDVTACSAVSHGWRHAFNLDRVWRRFCSFGPDFYKEEQNTVKPGFQVPFIEGADLEPLCEWRVNYLKESYIMRNWQKVRFSSEEAEIQGDICLHMKDGVDARGNHWMFLCCSSREGMSLEVWSLKDTPRFQMSMKMYDISKHIEEAAVQYDEINFKFHLSGHKLVFIVNNLISIYDFSPPHDKISFLCTFSVVHTHPFYVPKRLPQLPNGICEVEVIGNLLFAVTYKAIDISQQFSPSVHVWDIDKMVKVKDHCVYETKENLSETLGVIYLTHGTSDNLIITRTFNAPFGVGKSSRIRAFHMKKFEFTNFQVKTMSAVIWSAVAGDVVVFCELLSSQERDCVFHFYDVISNKCLLKTSIFNIYDPKKITSSGSKFAFIDLNSEVTVFDIVSQETFSSKLHPSRNRLKTLTLVNDHILLLESKYKGARRGFEDILLTSYEIWDFLKTAKPVRLDRCFCSVRRSKFTFMKDCRVPPKLLTLVHPLYRPNLIYVDSFW